ncbi:MAG: ABC transporter ATP-binding protein [Acidimicrobiia bacterium]|nr:ABC transporter ATP-binding protein [Acidimicrobiia bacterium]MXX46574.1 ABC transporter ATP-binding protein [Acidimicrobiia bacterium]MYA38092.1 ABC transporter ATP-binding protein [Acidimicrobiia bacterium]MYB78932.1 ABC transporter ATP-binding protein [Acidimicrobiia bacterium]MYD41731.1 ABC transporter ATP-binding protein [Acidimicrobiia bacterium]
MLELNRLSKRYGEVLALDECSFRVERGRMLGFLGPNGAGKTTAMRSVFNLVSLDEGSVTWRGRPVGQSERLHFGYMPEQRGLYPKMKIGRQLTYLGRIHGMTNTEAGAAAERWLEELGLSDRIADPLEKLSHGNQQRVQLAAALIHDPELMVLDEPFSGLDPFGVETMSEILRARAASGAAVVFSSHQLDMVEDLCQDVAIIHQGRVVMGGEVRRLKLDSPYWVIEVEMRTGDTERLSRLDSVVSVDFDGYRHRIVVRKGGDLSDLVSLLDLGGDVRHFTFSAPSLSELFREAVMG